MLKKLVLSLSFLTLVPLLAIAESEQASYVAGKNYDLITPALRTANPDKIEVVEFFWYGCGHCYAFEPMITAWKKNLPEDVDFHGSPAMWSPVMELHAQAFYTAQVLGVLDTMHPVIFQAINVDHKRLDSEAALKDLFVANGVDGEAFTRAFNSFGVTSLVKQANARARSAKITGTPSMMVNGKYRISTSKAGSQAGMLKIADYLVAEEREAGTGEQ